MQNPTPLDGDRDRPEADGPYAPQNRGTEYHSGDRPFQIPWWVIVIAFVITAWPVGIALLILNALLRTGAIPSPKSGSGSAKAHRKAEWTTVRIREKTGHTWGEQTARVQKRASHAAADASELDESGQNHERGKVLPLVLTIVGAVFAFLGLLILPNSLYWLPDALMEGGYYWRWVLGDMIPCLALLSVSGGFLFAGRNLRTGRRMRRKIDNIVGDARWMKIQDIADAIPCSYAKCCRHLENCIDKGVFGPDAYLDMRTKTLVVRGAPPRPKPEPEPKPRPEPEPKPQAAPTAEHERCEETLRQLRELNDAIPGEEMSEKISRLEALSAKIFAQAEQDPEKLPQLRKFMDYYLPTSLKLLETYAELDAQGVEGENIRESKQRIEQVMDTLVKAFENQLDKLFASDALDVTTDISVMENMLRADGLTQSPDGSRLTL